MKSPEPSEELTPTANVIVKPSQSSTPRTKTPDSVSPIGKQSVPAKEELPKTPPAPRFQVPQDVIKNLTPLRTFNSQSSLSKIDHARERRQEHLDSIRNRLNRRSIELSKRLQTLQSQTQEETARKISRSNKDLHEKKQRRSKYLDVIRDRASKFYLHGVSRSFNQTIKKTKKKTKTISSPSLQEEGDTFIINIQRRCRLILFQKYISILQGSKFLDIFETYSLDKIIKILNTDSNIKQSIFFILKYLNVPQLFGAGEYKSFFYCFIMVGDFNDCIRYDKHPGFNANTSSNEPQLMFYNSIWLFVFKFTKLVINEFKVVIEKQELTEKFLKCWNFYNFLFKNFKWHHYRNICDILCDALDIVNSQIEAIDNSEGVTELVQQRSKLTQEWTLLKSYNILELRQFNESIEAEEFKKSIQNIISNLYDGDTAVRNVFIQNKPRVIRFNSCKFYLPSCEILPVNEWRKFWVDKFQYQIDSNRVYPSRLRSGCIKNLIKSDSDDLFLHLDDILQNQQELKEYDCLNRLPQIYGDLQEYYLEFSNVKSDWRIEQQEEITYNDYLKLIYQLIRHYDCENKSLLDLAAKINHNGTISNQAIKEFEVYVCNLWINKSKFNKFGSFQQFENIFKLINSPNFSKLKFNIFTTSPNLIFVNFYKILLKYNEPNLDFTEEYRQRVLSAAFKVSILRVLVDLDVSNSRQYFTNLFHKIIVYEQDYQIDELNDLYVEKINWFHSQTLQVINSTVFILLYSNYIYPNGIQRALLTKEQIETIATGAPNQLETILQHANIEDHGFFKYYLESREAFTSLLQGKFLQILQHSKPSPEFHTLVEGNFKDFNKEVLDLVYEIWKSTSFIYKLYNPILNWIYLDLGY
ncbi:hypothetical protein JA1_002031 [Spathaspora sp. JA1]|nr:hypothetical protein JA1_002031 [Spathaspora sp. JA1]